jgi:hypothetical protein
VRHAGGAGTHHRRERRRSVLYFATLHRLCCMCTCCMFAV